MKRVIDFTGEYKPEKDEIVTRANIKYLKLEELKMFDKVVALERDREKFDGVSTLTLVKDSAKAKGARRSVSKER